MGFHAPQLLVMKTMRWLSSPMVPSKVLTPPSGWILTVAGCPDGVWPSSRISPPRFGATERIDQVQFVPGVTPVVPSDSHVPQFLPSTPPISWVPFPGMNS